MTEPAVPVFAAACHFMFLVKEAEKKIRNGRTKNESVKEIVGVKGRPDITDSIEKKRLQWYGHVKRMLETST